MANGDSTDDGSAAAANPALAAAMLGGGGMMPGYGYGMGGMAAQPAMAALQPQLMFGQGLLRQAADASPVRSPWQAAARAIGGLLGGYEVGQYGQQMQGLYRGWQQQAGNILGDVQGAMQQGAQPAGAPAQAPTQQPTPAPANLDAAITTASAKTGIPKPVLVGLYSHESGFNPSAVNKDSGATGLGQVLISTATKPGYGMDALAPDADSAKQALLDPNTNIDFSSRYLAARGQSLYGNSWDPNNPTMMRAALNGYGDGTPGYADAVLAKGGAAVPTAAAPDPATNPGANMAAGWQAGNALQLRIAAGIASGNPLIQQMAPYLNQVAATMKMQGRFQNFTDPSTGTLMKRDLLTGAMSTAGPALRPEQTFASQIAQIGANIQQGKAPTEGEKAQLDAAIPELYQPKMELDVKTGIYQPTWGKTPPAWVAQYWAQRTGGAAQGAPGGTTAAPGTTQPTQPAPTARTPAQVEASITGGVEDYKADSDVATKFAQTAASGDDTLAANQSIRSILASGKVKPGQFAPFMAQVANIMRGAGYDDRAVQKITGIDPVAAQELNKYLFQLQTSKLREMGAREPGSVMQMFTQNYPSTQSRPQTIDALTRSIDMQVYYAQDRAAAMAQWMQDHRGDMANYQRVGSPAFNTWFQAQHNPREYAAAALAGSTGGDGKPVPYMEWADGLKDKAAIERVTGLVNQHYPGTMIDYGQHGLGTAGGP